MSGESRGTDLADQPPDGLAALDLGYRAAVVVDERVRGVLLHEPFLLARGDRLLSADGHSRIEQPIGRLV